MPTRRQLKRQPDPLSLYKRYQDLGSVHRVAKEFGVCGETVRSWIKKSGGRLNGSDWSESENKKISDYYKNTPSKDFSLDRLANIMGRSRASVALRASRMGLGNFSREKATKVLAAIQPSLPWSVWVKHPHPRGASGLRHTESAKRIISEKSLKNWAKQKATGTGNMSSENLQKKSDRTSKMNAQRIASGGNNYSRCRRGVRGDIGKMFFRSAWEANYARWLNLLISQKKIIRWEYEVETFWFEKMRRGVRSYTPDFKVWTSDVDFHFEEVKGWMDKKSATKLNRMRIYHPLVKIVLIDEKRYRGIASTAKGIVPNWE